MNDFVETAGGDMVTFIHASFITIAERVDNLWIPEPLTTSKKTSVDDGGVAAASDHLAAKCGPEAGVGQRGTKCATMARRSESKAETRSILAAFVAKAHLAKDLRPNSLAELRRVTSSSSDLGLSSTPTAAPTVDAASSAESLLSELAATAAQPHLAPVPGQ